MKRFKGLVKIIGILLVSIVVIIVAIALRLNSGPMSIASFDGFIRQSVTSFFPEYDIQFREPSLYWNKAQDTIDIQLSDVTFTNGAGEVVARAPFIGLAASKPALLQGKFHPTRLDLIGPFLEITWSAQALMKKMEPEVEEVEGEPFNVLAENNDSKILGFVESMMSKDAMDGTLSAFQTISILEANFWFIEKDSGARWHLPKANLQINKNAEGLNVSLDAELLAGEQKTKFEIRSFTGENDIATIRLSFEPLNVATLASSVGLKGLFNFFDVPVFGTVVGEFDEKGHFLNSQFNLGGGRGQINLEELYEFPPQIMQMELVGQYINNDKLLKIETLNLDLSEGTMKIDGLVAFDDASGKPDMTLYATLNNMPIQEVLTYWPERLAHGGYLWVRENVQENFVNEAHFTLHMKPEYWGLKPMPEDALRIDFEFSDLYAHYLRPMSPLTGAMGVGVATPQTLSIDITAGQSGNITIDKANFSATDMADPDKRHGVATFEVNTSIAELLKFVDQEPLNKNKPYEIIPQDYSGSAMVHGQVGFPLEKGNNIDDITLDINVQTKDGANPVLLPYGGMREANLDIDINKNGIKAAGSVIINDVPMLLNWTERFSRNIEDKSPHSRYEVTASLNSDHLARFGVPAVGRMDGSMEVNLVINANGHQLIDGQGIFDLQHTTIHSPRLALWKRAETPGQGRFTLKWTGQTFWLDDLEVSGAMVDPLDFNKDMGEFSIQASMHFDGKKGRLLEAYIPRIQSFGHDLSLAVNLSVDNYIELKVDANRVDLSPFLNDLVRKPQGTDYIPEAVIKINANTATALNGIQLKNLKLDAWNSGGYWATSEMSSEFDGDYGTFNLVLSGTYEGRHLEIKSDNAGRLAVAAGLFLNGAGGDLQLSAELGPPARPDEIKGTLSIDNFRVVKSSPFVMALENTSGYEMDKLISANGLQMSKLYVPFSVKKGLIDISSGHANGPSMGFTIEGQYNQRSKEVNLNGLIIPAYTLNSFLGKLPLIGGLLGGKDGGLFAITYRIKGQGDKTETSFNPLSAIAPGFLRKIFEGSKGQVKTTPIEPTLEEIPAPQPQ